MPAERPSPARDGRRLHPSSLLFSLLRHVKAYAVPALLVLLFSKGDRVELWLGLILIPVMVFEIYRYFSLRYRLLPEELVVTDGVFFKNERHVPLSRIQNVDLVQNPLQRLFGVADVRIETAGGSEPEAVLRVLSEKLVAELREHIFAGRREPNAPLRESDADQPLVLLTSRDILLLGLDPGRGLALFFVVLGAAYEFGLFQGLRRLEEYSGLLDGLPGWALWLLGAAAALFGAALLLALSVSWTWLRLGGFRVERNGDDFRLQSGVLTRLAATVPGHRIQSITVAESLMQRWFARVSVKVETAGGGGESEGDLAATLRRRFAPLLPTGRLPAILDALEPGLDFAGLEWNPLAPRAGRRMTRKAVLLALLLVLLLGVSLGPWWLASAFLLVPLAVIHARREARFSAWARPAGGLAYRSGVLTRRWRYVADARLQVVARRESPFDRRYQMASLCVDTAGSRAGGPRIAVPYLERSMAEALRAELAQGAEAAGFSWS